MEKGMEGGRERAGRGREGKRVGRAEIPREATVTCINAD